MKISKIDYSATGAFPTLVTDYLAQDSKLKPFYNRFPNIAAFADQMQEKNFPDENRAVLVQALKDQYASVADIQPLVKENIDLLAQPNTYTVTTGHQLNIFTG